MWLKKIYIFLVTFISCSVGFSQAPDKQKLDEYIQVMGSNNKFMGTVLVYQQNKKVYSRTVGFSNINLRTKLNDQTMFRIGSVSKTITASLILKAVEEGKINLSDTIKAFFPSIQHAGQITICDLLNHHSGIHDLTGGNFTSWRTQPKNRQDLIDSIANGGSDFMPGTKAVYSNSNYVLLSFILEDIYHLPYASILKNEIIQPLHLRHFQLGDKTVDLVNIAIPYNFDAGWNAVTLTDLSIPMGAGAIVSSADDLAKVLQAIFKGKIVSRSMLAKMQAQNDGFGFGIFEKTIHGKTAYTHDGAIDGFNSYFYYFPQDETLYILLSNAENYKLETVNEALLSIVFNKPFELPEFKRYAVTSGDLQQYPGAYKSPNTSLVIDVSVKNDFLLAQPHGQKAYTMEATGKDKFLHGKTGVTLEFIPVKKQMIMRQGKQEIIFTRQ